MSPYFLLAAAIISEVFGSLAYAIWSGAGTALTALIGVLVWKDPFRARSL